MYLNKNGIFINYVFSYNGVVNFYTFYNEFPIPTIKIESVCMRVDPHYDSLDQLRFTLVQSDHLLEMHDWIPSSLHIRPTDLQRQAKAEQILKIQKMEFFCYRKT